MRSKQSILPSTILSEREGAALGVFSELQAFGVTEASFRQARQKLASRFRQEPSIFDVLWGLIQAGLVGTTDAETFSRLKVIEASCLFAEGRDPLRQKRLEAERAVRTIELKRLQQQEFVVGVEVLAAAGCCPACNRLAGRRFKLGDAIRLQPLPCGQCSNEITTPGQFGHCRCAYGLVFATGI